MTDPESIQAFIDSRPTAARSFWQKLRKKIDGTSAAEKKILRRMSTAERLWADAFQAASERANGVQQTISKRVKTKARKPETTKSLTEKSRKNMRYSAKKKAAKNGSSYDFTKSFAQQIDDWIAGKIPKNDSLLVGKTPEVFQKIGFNALPMTINQTHVDYAINGTKNTDHTIGADGLKQLPQALEHPVAVIASKTQGDTSVVALLPFTHNGNTVIAPVVIDGYAKQNNVLLDSNAVTSIHGRSNAIVKLLADALNNYANGQNTLFYWNKKQAIALLQKARVIMPKDSAQARDGYIASIRDADSPVKPKLKNVTESVQFKRWFGDWQRHTRDVSKIQNADGSPKIVYYKAEDAHGNIHLLDTENGGEAVYLNMRNPYRVKQKPNAQAEAQLIQYAKSEGYDGIIIPDSTSERYITFKQENIKSVDNVGTFDRGNADIRYSVKPRSAESYESEIERLKKQRDEAKRQIKLSKYQQVSPAGIKRMAQDLLAEYRSTANAEELTDTLQTLYNILHRRPELIDTNGAYSFAESAAELILDDFIGTKKKPLRCYGQQGSQCPRRPYKYIVAILQVYATRTLLSRLVILS